MQGDGGEAFRDLDDSDNAVTAAHALTEVRPAGAPLLPQHRFLTCAGSTYRGINVVRVPKLWPDVRVNL